MICPNCGKELLEGEVCTCQSAPTEPVNPNPVAEQTAFADAGTYQQSYNQQIPPYQQPIYNAPPISNPEPRTDYPKGYKIKKKYVAVILAACLGPLGIHNFYLERKDRGLAQLLICTVGSIFAGLGAVVALVWALVEAVQLLTEDINTDANGFKIQTLDEAFKANNNNE